MTPQSWLRGEAEFGKSRDMTICKSARETSFDDAAYRHRRLEEFAPIARRLSHDFDNILTGIMGFSELALAQLDNNSPARPFVEEILHAARQGTAMTGQLRWFSRRNAPTGGYASLSTLLAQEETVLRSMWGKDIRLDIELPEGLLPIAVAPEPLGLLLRHLLSNAREALGDKGNVCISAKAIELTQLDCSDLIGSASPGSFIEIAI